MADVILVEVADRVATVTMNRPDARNALSRELLRALTDAVRTLDADDAVDVMVLTGADPAFCAGLDLKELGSGEQDLGAGSGSARESITRGPMPLHAKPIIGAVNGVAVTGGFEVALNCDWLIASERARFADTHARVGIQPGWGLTALLAEAVGVRRAKQMSATGNFLDAETALEWGLVNAVVAHDDLLPAAWALAADIVSNDQRAVQRILQTYREGSLMTAGDWLRHEGQVSAGWLQQGGGTAADVEARRRDVMARGRSQTS